MLNLSKEVKVTRVMDAVAAGKNDTQEGTVLDMAGFDGVVFIAALGTLTATAITDLRAQQGKLADGSDMADLEGTKVSLVAGTDDNKLAVLDVYRPQERYVQCNIVRATEDAVIDGVIALQYKGRKAPVTHDPTTVAGAELHVSPDEGTA